MVYAIGADLCAKLVLGREHTAMIALVCEMLCERVPYRSIACSRTSYAFRAEVSRPNSN